MLATRNRHTNLTQPNLYNDKAYPSFGGYELWRLRLYSFGGYGLALVVFGHIESIPEVL